ncbi:MAG: phosphatidylinositol kinase [Balneolaceae bacterium]|nr:MAG: phosphatidylinositol kinase [Balneolaceae bacterium]
MSYRKAVILVDGARAGVLEETESGYRFQYERDYLARSEPDPVSLTLPVREQAFDSGVLFPFFDGLIPEGWLLDVVQDTWKVNPGDRMGLLLVSCRDTIGNVSVREP